MPPLVMNPVKEYDSTLLAAVAAGDRRALEQLYLSYHRRLARFLSRFTSRYENVEEIINDTFMVVWRKAQGFRWESQVSSWIFGIAHRTALKLICKNRRREDLGESYCIGESQVETVDPILQTETRDWLASGLNRLPIEQRLTLELAFHMGHSLTEVAVITGAPVGTV